MKQYSVWVGGGEVNDYYLPLDKALHLASQWADDGYDDVLIMEGEEKKFYSPNHPTFRKGVTA
jgi:hypothetical protein